jgi:hypothetical protein
MLEAKPPHRSFSASTTQAFYAGILREDQVRSMSQSICANLPMGHDSLCAVFGYGNQPTSTYKWLSRLPGVEVPWDRNFGPWWLAPLLWIAASRGGLVIVEARDKVAPVLDALGRLAMLELFSCSRHLRDEMTRHVQEHTWRSHPGLVASTDDDYFAFGFDGDSDDPDGGIYTWCAVGNGCPRDLTDCLSDYTTGL